MEGVDSSSPQIILVSYIGQLPYTTPDELSNIRYLAQALFNINSFFAGVLLSPTCWMHYYLHVPLFLAWSLLKTSENIYTAAIYSIE